MGLKDSDRGPEWLGSRVDLERGWVGDRSGSASDGWVKEDQETRLGWGWDSQIGTAPECLCEGTMAVRRNVGGLWNMHAVTRRVPECSVCRKVRMTPHGSSHKRVSDVEDLMSHDQRDDDQRVCGSGLGRR